VRKAGEKEVWSQVGQEGEVVQAHQLGDKELAMSATASRAGSAGARRGAGMLAALALAVALVSLVRPALAQASFKGTPHWQLESRSAPSVLEPGEQEAQIRVSAVNLGDASAPGPITISDKLPAGIVATAITLREGDVIELQPEDCRPVTEPILSCTWTETEDKLGTAHLPPRVEIPPYARIEVIITVRVEAGSNAPEANTPSEPDKTVNQVKVEGGAPAMSLAQQVTIGDTTAPVPFGAEKFEFKAENENGSPATQAGEHPFQLTTTLDFNQGYVPVAKDKEGQKVGGEHPTAAALVRDLNVDIPPGLLADASAVPPCPTAAFTQSTNGGLQGNLNACEADSAVGVASVTFFTPSLGFQTRTVPVFNLKPQQGEPARFGFETASVPVFMDTSVRTGENYGATVSIENASTSVEVLGSIVTIWGVPGAEQHESSRGWECVDNGFYEHHEGELPPLKSEECPEEATPQAQSGFLTLPTTCGEAQESTVEGSPWPTTAEREGRQPEQKLQASYSMPLLSGCEKLPFEPGFKLEPGKHAASSPTGLDAKIEFEQGGILAAGGLAAADVRETAVTLPEGVQANAGAANGLASCSVQAAGFSRSGSDTGETLERDIGEQQFSNALVSCPEASKLANVSIKTPLLPNPLNGFVYLAEQDTNPFASPLVVYLIAEDPVSGVRVELAGEVKINETTGQLESVFKGTPPLPFESLNFELYEGQRASQTTPAFCGQKETKAVLVSSSGEQVAHKSAAFDTTENCQGSPLSFAPSFEAGTTINQAYSFTPFTLTIGRPDAQQGLKSITMHLPPGLAAIISSVAECPEPASGQEWSCGPESEIGQSIAVSGLGTDPVTLGGKVYFGGPYQGAPFSIIDITPATAGPFHLGNVVVRSTINVDPTTAAATITSDPLPQFVKGVPSQIKELNVTVNRPGFEFNPTNCSPMKIEGTLDGYEGGSESVSSPFQVANCASLPFAPVFTASTTSRTSKTDGANLFVKITYPNGAYANVAKSITELPYALPSRLTTIQKACPDTVFEANPAACDEGSEIGHAIVHTPVFKTPLVGPAYLVSHGNRAFPDIEIVLQGEGITLVLDGHTDIKNSITKTSFESVPDAPVEVFELILPEGPHSALAANDNLCKPEKPGTVTEKVAEHVKGRTIEVTKKVHKMVPEELVIPTKLVAQNGRVLEQRTKIAVSGCGAVKASKTTKKPAKKAKKSSKKK
jgi:hypothetical protein